MARESVRVFAKGRGPGPYNVGIILPNGRKQVVTYRTFKYKYKESTLADYASAFGFVQFEPQEREANGQKVVDYTIKTPGMDGQLIRITVWPELQGDPINRGDFLAVDGKLTINSYEKDGERRQSIQISAKQLVTFPGREPADREVVNAPEVVKDLF